MNNFSRYTNQAKEFNSPASHQGEVSMGNDGGAAVDANNHRSWHPVMAPTGRDTTTRHASASLWKSPFDNAVGTQTMYCTDCHGSATGSGTAIPAGTAPNGSPWGPHGSANDFILKGTWSWATGNGDSATGICFKCHDYNNYATRNATGSSGFGGPFSGNLHAYHADKIGKMRCSWCHVAVPHGWKNKALLVNLNDRGPEGGGSSGQQVRNGTTSGHNSPPYYVNAILKVKTFAASGAWVANDCGSKGPPGNSAVGKNWMVSSTENCASPP